MMVVDCRHRSWTAIIVGSLLLWKDAMAFLPQRNQRHHHSKALFVSSMSISTPSSSSNTVTTTPTTESDESMKIASDNNNSVMAVATENLSKGGHAYDVVMIHSEDTGRITCSDFMLEVDPLYNRQVLLEIKSSSGGKVYFPIMEEPPKVDPSLPRRLRKLQGPARKLQHPIQFDKEGNARRLYTKSPEEIELARGEEQELQQQQVVMSMLKSYLKPGANTVRYIFMEDGRVDSMATAQMFLWSDKDRVVVCDVDGTITKSNVRGVVNTIVRERFKKHIHPGVCHFFSRLLKETNEEGGGTVRVLYVTSRPISLVEYTRKLLTNLEQYKDAENENGYTKPMPSSSPITCNSMPSGPLMGFSGSLRRVLKMELLSHSVHWFKSKLLWDQVVSRFRSVQSAEEQNRNVFLAGFGNSVMDMKAYHMAGMNLNQMYWISKQSIISCLDSQDDIDLVLDDNTFDSTDPFLTRSTSTNTKTILSRKPETAEEEIIANTMMEATTVMKQPLGKSDYKSLRGTRFGCGYEDVALISHVLAESK